MAVRLAAIQASVATTWTYIQSSLMAPQIATGISMSALYSLQALLKADGEQVYGWWRAAVHLCDINRPLLLDSLGDSQVEKYQLRLSALRDLPEVTALGSLDDIHTFITGAISIGAPRYNTGDIVGCCIVYWATMMALVSAPVFRGFPGHARAVGQLKEIVEQLPSPAAIMGQAADDFAWQLRHILNDVLAIQG